MKGLDMDAPENKAKPKGLHSHAANDGRAKSMEWTAKQRVLAAQAKVPADLEELKRMAFNYRVGPLWRFRSGIHNPSSAKAAAASDNSMSGGGVSGMFPVLSMRRTAFCNFQSPLPLRAATRSKVGGYGAGESWGGDAITGVGSLGWRSPNEALGHSRISPASASSMAVSTLEFADGVGTAREECTGGDGDGGGDSASGNGGGRSGVGGNGAGVIGGGGGGDASTGAYDGARMGADDSASALGCASVVDVHKADGSQLPDSAHPDNHPDKDCPQPPVSTQSMATAVSRESFDVPALWWWRPATEGGLEGLVRARASLDSPCRD
ncbi:hypothetical protein BD410DRAFT_807585 [Rickenella mellea]|uniref:Uncharacterized protein n=1 Tax=Rickenella mellea TaxID=50990 RepID=A0A4Y7PPL7_9AGAM|nr:hypothetical protein BD410DRAFT_807585 [Rickenella mellea]